MFQQAIIDFFIRSVIVINYILEAVGSDLSVVGWIKQKIDFI